MPEYIEREATLHRMKVEIRPPFAVVRDMPAADVVEVVRCKDCKHLMFSDMYGECGRGCLGIVSPNDYCSRGVRKGEGE